MADTNLTQLVINQLTRAQYDALQPQANQLYLVTDEPYLDTSYVVTSVGVSSTDVKIPSAKAVYNYVHNNSEGFLRSITSSQVTTALGYTPYNSTNPAGYITGITSAMVTSALGYTPYNSTNPSGYQTATNVNSAISTHNTNQTAHQDIRNAIIKNLSGLNDVAVSGVTTGQFLSWNGSKWVPSTSSSTINWGDVGGTLSNQTDLNTALAGKQPLLPAGTTGYYLQKTASGVQWSEVQSAPPVDNVSISLNQSDQLQAFGTINQNGTGTALKHWSGTLAEYNDIASKSSNTLYHITDDSDVTLSLLQTIYPVGSIYITTNATCPLGALFGTWQLVAADKVLQGAGSRGAVGTTINESLPNIKGSITVYAQAGNQNKADGAFSYENGGGSGESYYVQGNNPKFTFNAHDSNATYQDDAPVQQDAYLVNIFRRTA